MSACESGRVDIVRLFLTFLPSSDRPSTSASTDVVVPSSRPPDQCSSDITTTTATATMIDWNAKDDVNQTAFQKAALRGHADTVALIASTVLSGKNQAINEGDHTGKHMLRSVFKVPVGRSLRSETHGEE